MQPLRLRGAGRNLQAHNTNTGEAAPTGGNWK
jgi:hypothetical protein